MSLRNLIESHAERAIVKLSKNDSRFALECCGEAVMVRPHPGNEGEFKNLMKNFLVSFGSSLVSDVLNGGSESDAKAEAENEKDMRRGTQSIDVR